MQVPSGGRAEQQLRADAPPAVADGRVVVQAGPTDSDGRLEAITVGDVVLSVPSPEALRREPDAIRRAVGRAGAGPEPLVVVIQAADELREDELAALLDAAAHAHRPVMVRVIADG